MRIILLKLLRMLAFCCVPSVISCMLYYYNFIKNTNEAYSVILAVIFAIFFLDNLFMLRWCYRSNTRYRKKKFYLYNYSAYGLFVLISVLTYIFLGEAIYALLFNTLKLLTFAIVGVTTFQSSLISHLIIIALIAITPYTVHKHRHRGEKQQ